MEINLFRDCCKHVTVQLWPVVVRSADISSVSTSFIFYLLPLVASFAGPWPRATQCSGPASNHCNGHPENEISLGTDSPPFGSGTGEDAR